MDLWRRLQSAGSSFISTSRAEMSFGAAGTSACATKEELVCHLESTYSAS